MKRFVHKTNSDHKTSLDLGVLYPIQFLDVMAGQTTYLKNNALFRFQPMVAPALVKMNAYFVSFFCPYRLLWPDWDNFITGQKKLQLPLTKIKLQAGFDVINVGFARSLLDYAGFPISFQPITGLNEINLNFPFFWFMAYHKIWDEHFRGDDKIQPPLDMDTYFQWYKDGLTVGAHNSIEDYNRRFKQLYGLRRVNWGKDRFTQALVNADMFDITIPLANPNNPMEFRFPDNGGLANLISLQGANDNGTSPSVGFLKTGGGRIERASNAYYKAGLKDISLKEFRQATDLYNFMQNRLRFGNDVKSYFAKYGIRNLDGRLDRSEVIGGFSQTMQISDVIATSSQDLGKQGGHASGFLGRKTLKHYASEHGVIITMLYIRPKADYAGGIPRFFLKRDMLDFYQAEFNSGYQQIFKGEVSAGQDYTKIPVSQDEMEVFGYEEKYSEYRRESNLVTSELRPGGPLSHWASPRHWRGSPSLNSDFLTCNPPNNIWASPNTDKVIAYISRGVTKKCFVPRHSKQYFKL